MDGGVGHWCRSLQPRRPRAVHLDRAVGPDPRRRHLQRRARASHPRVQRRERLLLQPRGRVGGPRRPTSRVQRPRESGALLCRGSPRLHAGGDATQSFGACRSAARRVAGQPPPPRPLLHLLLGQPQPDAGGKSRPLPPRQARPEPRRRAQQAGDTARAVGPLACVAIGVVTRRAATLPGLGRRRLGRLGGGRDSGRGGASGCGPPQKGPSLVLERRSARSRGRRLWPSARRLCRDREQDTAAAAAAAAGRREERGRGRRIQLARALLLHRRDGDRPPRRPLGVGLRLHQPQHAQPPRALSLDGSLRRVWGRRVRRCKTDARAELLVSSRLVSSRALATCCARRRAIEFANAPSDSSSSLSSTRRSRSRSMAAIAARCIHRRSRISSSSSSCMIEIRRRRSPSAASAAAALATALRRASSASASISSSTRLQQSRHARLSPHASALTPHAAARRARSASAAAMATHRRAARSSSVAEAAVDSTSSRRTRTYRSLVTQRCSLVTQRCSLVAEARAPRR